MDDSPSEMAIIEFASVNLRLGADEIYDSLSFTVKEREFVCIVGPSGCGKSTLLRLMGDLITPTSGTISINGLPPSQTWKQIAYVFQSPRLAAWRTAISNVMLGRQLRFGEKSSDPRLVAKAREFLSLVGLEREERKFPLMLSGGERQRVSIARALMVDPDIILMDEPLSALDINNRRRLRAKVLDIWQATKKTVVFVTHDIDDALALADKVIVLSAKPSRIVDIIEVTTPRPRQLDGPELSPLRTRLEALLQDDQDLGAVAAR